MSSNSLKLLIGLVLNFNFILCSDEKNTININMPEIQPQHNDDYYCTAVKLNPDERSYIKNFIPHAEKSYAHHMLLYTCEEPGQQKAYWKCGEMYGEEGSPQCKKGAKIIYAWAMNARPLKLENDISFEVGGNTDAKYIVLNVHYKDVSQFNGENAKLDSSGFTLELAKEKTPKLAGIYLLASGGVIGPHSKVTQETACQMNQKTVMHPFAFRTHTHSHGVKVSGYRIHNNTWDLIGEMDPQKEQMFYEVENPDGVIIKQHDFIAARCDFVNNEDRTVITGETQNDEMCNFYIMYYVDGVNEVVADSVCAENFDWKNFFGNMNIKIPDILLNPFGDVLEEISEMEQKPDPLSLFMKLIKARQEEEELFDSRGYFPYMKRNEQVPMEYYRNYNEDMYYN